MTTATPDALADLQLVGAGVGTYLAITHIVHWVRRRTAWAGWFGAAAAAMAVVLVTNVLVLRYASEPALHVRAAALSATVVLIVLALLAFTGQRAPRTLALLGATAGARLALWATTDLVYAHRFVDRLPVYGPLVMLTALPLLVLLFGTTIAVAGRCTRRGERTTLLVGSSIGIAFATAMFAISDARWAEVLTGVWVLPELLVMDLAIVQRLVADHDSRQRALRAERALASLAALAVDERSMERLVERSSVVVAGIDDIADTRFLSTATHILDSAFERIEAEEQIADRALRDELTGLANRGVLHSSIAVALSRPDERAAVLFCDLDNFKDLNDALGHAAGDDVLVEVAIRLQSVVTEPDVVCRFGGDEFVVVTTAARADDVARRLLTALHGVDARAAGTTGVTMSVGIAEATDDDSVDRLVRDADTAMFRAKAAGGDSAVHFEPSMRTELLDRLTLERALAAATARGEIAVAYQPIVDLTSGRVLGYEALARWHRGGEVVEPADWVPHAERTGAIVAIGEHVLRTACLDALVLAEDVYVTVNVSGRQLSPEFASVVDAALATGLDPRSLTLELTESTLADDPVMVADLLANLRRRGVRIAIDDFGTGFSSLSQLAALPVDVLKIDRTFVARLDTADGYAVVETILGLARVLDIDVVAEGIESTDQVEQLHRLGCEFGQGYLFGRPVPLECRAPGDILRPQP